MLDRPFEVSVAPVLAGSSQLAEFIVGAEIPVRHHPRRFGHSKYGLSRIWKVLADLMAVMMIRWYLANRADDKPVSYVEGLSASGLRSIRVRKVSFVLVIV